MDSTNIDPLAQVRWIPPDQNPFGVDLLDCRLLAQSMTSTTKDREVATTFLALRASSGEENRGRSPENAKTYTCDLQYPHSGEAPDGPLFKAKEMEDKWDIYLYDGQLYFDRSWTGLLIYRAAIVFHSQTANVVAVEAPGELVEGDASYPVAAVDYLIRSHLYHLAVPHPLPRDMGRNPRELALFSFSRYGRRGLYGTFADTTRLQPLPKE
jgi:hypothetical protein